jgi:hypothetical protein
MSHFSFIYKQFKLDQKYDRGTKKSESCELYCQVKKIFFFISIKMYESLSSIWMS